MNTSMKAMEESCSLIPIHEPRYPPSFLSSLGVTGVEFFPSENVFHNEKPIDGKTISKRYNNFGDASLISNLPTLDMTSSLVSCSLGLNPKMFDLHTSYSESCEIQPCYDAFGLNENIALCHSDMHGRENSPSNSSKVSILCFFYNSSHVQCIQILRAKLFLCFNIYTQLFLMFIRQFWFLRKLSSNSNHWSCVFEFHTV